MATKKKVYSDDINKKAGRESEIGASEHGE